MGFYERVVLPRFLEFACSLKPIRYQRQKVLPRARGRVLEVGMGTGLNLPFYDPAKVELVWGLEPSQEMRRRAEPRAAEVPFEVRFLDLPGEEIPLENNSVDTVLLTFTLCSIPGAREALEQMRRVLKPGGELVFCEHGEAPDESVRRWQHRIEPFWKKIAGGCHITRPIPQLIEEAGFKITEQDRMYIPGTAKILAFQYWGSAEIA